jgi:hypothetical protein
MGKYGGQAREKLTTVLHPGEELQAAAVVKGPLGRRGPTTATSGYQKELGLDPYTDVAYVKRVSDGYLGITDTRLILAKSPLWGKVKPKHVVVDVHVEDCSLAWFDWERFIGTDRVIHLSLPDGNFAGLFVPVTVKTFLSDSDRAALVRESDAVVAAFGPRAMRIDPKAEWLK